jgi:uncharacterized protein (DUF302 family)
MMIFENTMRYLQTLILTLLLTACAHTANQQQSAESAIYEVAVAANLKYEDVIESMDSAAKGMNFVNPANFPIGEHIAKRDIDPQGRKEVRAYCNLSMGTDIFLDHPEFLVYAPCRVALYERKGQLFIGLARPTHDLRNIKNPSERARKAARELEDRLIEIINKASKGEI